MNWIEVQKFFFCTSSSNENALYVVVVVVNDAVVVVAVVVVVVVVVGCKLVGGNDSFSVGNVFPISEHFSETYLRLEARFR